MSKKFKLLTTAALVTAIAHSPLASAKGKPTVDTILPTEHVCSSTLFFRAQDMTHEQLVDSCNKVGAEESYFHSRLETNGLPVDNDVNEDLRMVIFDNYTNYNRYGGRLFGINTNYPTNTVWWSEGVAENISKEDVNADAIALINANGGNRTLAQVFAITYNNTAEEIYDWGYIGNRFMFENHMQDIRDLRAATRQGDWATYQSPPVICWVRG
jgi:microbial collagenase